MNGKVCIIRRYLCHDIKKPISYHGALCHDMSYVCHDYRGIPTVADMLSILTKILTVFLSFAEDC